MGTVVLGKIESGSTRKGAQLLMMPNRRPVEVIQLWSDEDEVNSVESGENVRIKLKGVEEEDVTAGFVLCDPTNPCKVARVFDAQVYIAEHKSIICNGYSAVLHLHAASEEVTVKAIICLIDKKSGEKSKVRARNARVRLSHSINALALFLRRTHPYATHSHYCLFLSGLCPRQTRPRFVKQNQVAIMRFECPAGMICMEPFSQFQQMGRFTLRDEGRTVAMGKVLRIVE